MAQDPDQSADRLAREIEHHRRIAPNAERFWSWSTPSGARRAQRRGQLFIEVGELGPGKRALEIGCGTGVFLEKVAASRAIVHGIDLSEDLLRRAHDRVRALENVHLHRGNVEQLPFPEAIFDAVYGSSILHHLDRAAALREVFRVLRPGGKCVFAEPNLLNPQIAFTFLLANRERLGVSPDEMAFSRFHARATLEGVGFAQVLVVPFDFLHPLVPRAWIDQVEWLGRKIERVPLVREIAGSLLMRATKS